jgi:hypothetical protein
MYIIKSYGINHDGVSQIKYMIKWIQTRLLTSKMLFYTTFKCINWFSLLSFKRKVIPKISIAIFKASFEKFSVWLWKGQISLRISKIIIVWVKYFYLWMNLSELVRHYYSRLYIRMLPWLSTILFPNFPSQEFEERQQIWSHNWRQLLFWQPDFGTFVNYLLVFCYKLPKGESSNRIEVQLLHL